MPGMRRRNGHGQSPSAPDPVSESLEGRPTVVATASPPSRSTLSGRPTPPVTTTRERETDVHQRRAMHDQAPYSASPNNSSCVCGSPSSPSVHGPCRRRAADRRADAVTESSGDRCWRPAEGMGLREHGWLSGGHDGRCRFGGPGESQARGGRELLGGPRDPGRQASRCVSVPPGDDPGLRSASTVGKRFEPFGNTPTPWGPRSGNADIGRSRTRRPWTGHARCELIQSIPANRASGTVGQSHLKGHDEHGRNCRAIPVR